MQAITTSLRSSAPATMRIFNLRQQLAPRSSRTFVTSRTALALSSEEGKGEKTKAATDSDGELKKRATTVVEGIKEFASSVTGSDKPAHGEGSSGKDSSIKASWGGRTQNEEAAALGKAAGGTNREKLDNHN